MLFCIIFCWSDRGNHANVILQDSLAKGDESKKLTIYTRAEINAQSTFFRKGADPESTQGKYSYPYTSAVNHHLLLMSLVILH